MAVTVTLINGKNPVSDTDYSSSYNDLYDGTSGVVGVNDYLVTQSGPVGMSVTIATGVANMFISSLSSYRRVKNDAATTLNISSNSSGSTRIDLACIKFDTTVTPNTAGTNVASLVIVQGVAGSGVPATPANHFKFAEVTVVNGAVSISTANCTDKRTLLNVSSRYFTSPFFQGKISGWISDPNTWTYSSTDGHTFVATINADVTGYIGLGDRIWLTNQAASQYFIVTAKSVASGVTTLTMYGGTTYSLTNTAITAPYYSHVKVPFGFNPDPSIWSEKLTDTASRTQSSPTDSTWYNPGSLSLAVPIGAWKLSWSADVGVASTIAADQKTTLSTANNSESDDELSARIFNYLGANAPAINASLYKEKNIILTAKTSYFLNCVWASAAGGSGVTSIGFRGDLCKTIIKAICAYL